MSQASKHDADHSDVHPGFFTALGPDQLQTRKAALKRRKQGLATASVLNVGFMHQHVQNQPSRIDKEMALAPFNLLPAVVAARPPFCVVFTD